MPSPLPTTTRPVAPRWRRRRRAVLGAAFVAAFVAAAPACAPPSWWEAPSTRWVGTTVPPARFARLERGVNLSHWFAQAPNDSARLDLEGGYTTTADLRKIRELGFLHVRLAFAPEPLFHPDDPERLDGPQLAALDRALDAILAEGLAVIVNMHPEQGGAFKKGLEHDDAHVERVARFWTALARHFSVRDPGLVFLAVMNEPEVRNRERWDDVQRTLLAAMRAGAPRHTLIATGARWGSAKDLVRLQPTADRNVVYDFHFYDPYEFTHQGATWAVDRWRYLRELPYPSSVGAVVPALGSIDTKSAKLTALKYGGKSWNAERLARRLSSVAEWADRHGARVICAEFGAYRPGAPPRDRVRWLTDTRTLLERNGFGWTVWDYASEGFGVVQGEGREPDAGVMRALGMKGD